MSQIVIIGAGPAGLMLAQLLHQAGIESVVLERRTREYVESRIRAGVIEQGTADVLDRANAGKKMRQQGQRHTGFSIAINDKVRRIDLEKFADGASVLVYGQTEIQRDLFEERARSGGRTFFETESIAVHDLDCVKPRVTFSVAGRTREVQCDYTAGCDGFHGVSREWIPSDKRRKFERVYPFSWLGLLVKAPPISDELLYVANDSGFALCSMRSTTRSRYYLQVPLKDTLEEWPDERFWQELRNRLPESFKSQLVKGPAIEKGLARLRSFVCEPMQYQRLYLARDSAHIVPPTGAKGLNLAASDVHYLACALIEAYVSGNSLPLAGYSTTALSRVWKSEQFSWWFTKMTRQLSHDGFDIEMRKAEFEYFTRSDAGKSVLAENYVGLAY